MIEQSFYFKRFNFAQARPTYKIVKLVEVDASVSKVRVSLRGDFTREEKKALEALSRKVNKERRERGIL